MLALTFLNPQDYDKIRQDDLVEIQGLQNMTPTSTFTVILKHSDHTQENFEVIHTYNQQQIQWVQEGSALNKIRRELSAS